MLIYLVFPFAFSGLFIGARFIKNKKLAHFLCALVPAIILFILLGFKGSNVGVDSQTYINAYYDLRNIPKFPNPDFFISIRTYNFNDEYGFILLAQLFSSMGIPYLVFQLLLYFIICFALFFSTWKLSKNAVASIIIFYCFTYFNFFVSGLRQAFAISLCLIALTIIITGGRTAWRTIFYFFFVGLAIFWHKSALIFVLPYFFLKIRIGNRDFVILLFLSLFFYLLGAEMYEFINAYTSFIIGGSIGDYAPFSFGEGLTAILMVGIIIFSYFLYRPSLIKNKGINFVNKHISFFRNSKVAEEKDEEYIRNENSFGSLCIATKKEQQHDYFSLYLFLTFIGTWLMYTNSYSVAFGRIHMYFSIFMIFLLPIAVEKIKNLRMKNLVLILLFVAFTGYFIYTAVLTNYLGIAPYVFVRGTI